MKADKPDIVETLMPELNLEKAGRNYKTLCPFHTERTPSLIVNPAKQMFQCFGCNEHGDVITFIQKYKGLSFKDALAYLGISTSGEAKPDKRVIRTRELIQQYRQWLDNYTNFLCNVLRRLDRAKEKAKTMKQVEAMAYHYHHEQIWEYHFEIMLAIDEKAKFDLYKELKYGRG